VATGILSEGQIAPATRDVLKKKRNIFVELADVTGFDLKARSVTTVQPAGRKVPLFYDSLIVAAGVGQSYFGHDEYSDWAPGMKSLADALEHRARIFGAFEMTEPEEDPAVRGAWLTFVVIGGGPTGVEIAARLRICRRGRSNAICGDGFLVRLEYSCSKAVQNSWLLSAINSRRKRPGNWRRTASRSR
jgi:NADH:ubiquinone reductase (H+-translocating)